ncbi:hypothetical protein ACFQ3C_15285 [Seohaeicola saemankumensis]|uniref:Uncharacterized protein n=1 Tax=Seohaeicola saemankumensis TaxID=481181 RepID=A0ABW3THP5_9RHOB
MPDVDAKTDAVKSAIEMASIPVSSASGPTMKTRREQMNVAFGGA